MITSKTMIKAYNKLMEMPRISEFSFHKNYKKDVFLLPYDVDFDIYEDSQIKTVGLGKEDYKVRDLIRVIDRVDDALNLQYSYTNVLTPLMYAESLDDILWHITTQGILFTKISKETIDWIASSNNKYSVYGKHKMDQLWLPCSCPIKALNSGEIIGVFNRRVSGWDGSHERPVIELLGAGGHLPTVWNEREGGFREYSIINNMKKEASEELGILIEDNNIVVFGGYKNYLTHELVILVGVEIKDSLLPAIQDYAVRNIDEDTQGIYLGRITDVLNDYTRNPEPYAGGRNAVSTNFPNQTELMKKVYSFLKNSGQ